MPELPDFLAPKEEQKPAEEMIRWYTVSYKSVALGLFGLAALSVGILTVLYPNWWVSVSRYLSGPQRVVSNANSLVRQVRFTNLEGEVRVRKANQVQWNSANVSMGLEEGDTVQTLHDGLARLTFPDGALYVVKPDTLIVLEMREVTAGSKESNVSVQVTSGVVDLSTARGANDSRVTFANAEARIHQESRALVSTNPQTNTHQITVSNGGASLTRGGEHIELAQYEQASFGDRDSQVVKAKVVAPPILLTPANNAPVVMAGTQPAEVEFTWNAVPGAEAYRLRVSTSALFASILFDRRLQSTSVRLPAFKEGNYYWSVTTYGSGEKESQASDPNQFAVLRQAAQGELLLLVDKYVQHGKVLEVVGRTEPGATVLVNNEPVFNVGPDGSFKHFTAPLANTGSNLVTITAQNSKGKVATLRKTITIQ